MAQHKILKKWLRILAFAGLGIVLFGFGGIFGTWFFLKSQVKGQVVAIPDLYGLSEKEARKKVEKKGLVLVVDGSTDVYSNVIPEGKVLLQIPRPQRQVKSGRDVEITLSAGPKIEAVPEMRGQTLSFAEVLLQQAETKAAIVSKTPSELGTEGRVLVQYPPAGETLGLRQGVSLLVSLGQQDPYYVMPDLVGKTYNVAQAFLDRHNFKVVSKYHSQDPKLGQIILEQFPKAGYPVTKSQHVTLVINKDY